MDTIIFPLCLALGVVCASLVSLWSGLRAGSSAARKGLARR
ncbi:hypothetical protein [Sphingomonas sp. IC081]|nr:hypothetical protein [Sphingomonas sp. IC081]